MAKSGTGKTLVDDVYSSIKDDICLGRLKPGQRLLLGAIREEKNVSLSVVREAVTRLVSERLVRTKSQQGFTVWPLSADELVDLTRVRIHIETLALRDSFINGDREWEARVLSAHHLLVGSMASNRAEPVEGPNYEWMKAHSVFHAVLASACTSPLLQQLRQQLFDSAELYRHWSASLSERPRDIAGEHEAFLNAALAHDADLAVKLITEHIELTTDTLLLNAALPAETP